MKMLAKIATDNTGLVTFIGWANPDQSPLGTTLGNGIKVYEVDKDEFNTVDHNHAYFKDGHLIQDPDFVPYVPEPVEAPKELTNEQITKAIAQMTVLIAQRGHE